MIKFKRFLFLIMAISAFSCKKSIENKQRDLLIEAITNGVWIVEQFTEATVDITADFSGYEFQFAENGGVNATKNASTTPGTWVGDITSYSISSNFPGANDPLKKLNGTWKLTDSYWDYVEAEMITQSGKNILHLRKKP